MIQVENVTKKYGAVTAVDGVSFKLETSQITGFLGPNGAGKSTLLKMISTWLIPTAGRITVDGFDTQKEPLAVRRSLGYLPEHNALYDGMRVDRFLVFIAQAHGLSGARMKERIEWAVNACSIQPVLTKRCFQCSKGNRQRVGLAAALLHDPKVILLDEPTHGLDPLQVVKFREFLMQLREGRTIFFSSHILSEVLGISERVIVIQHGKLIHDGPVTELEKQARERKSDVETIILDTVRKAGVSEAGREVRA